MKTSPSWSAVLWDKDGTLIDSLTPWMEFDHQLALNLAHFYQKSPQEALRYADQVMLTLGVLPTGRLNPRGLLATGTQQTILTGFWQASQIRGWDLPLESFLTTSQTLLTQAYQQQPPHNTAFAGLAAVLERLAKLGIEQGLATADNVHSAQRDLAPSGMDRWLSFGSYGDTALRPKPDPWSVLAFAQHAQRPAHQILVIGDTPLDQQMARTAGADFGAVLWGSGQIEDFLPGTRFFQTPAEILAAFNLTV